MVRLCQPATASLVRAPPPPPHPPSRFAPSFPIPSLSLCASLQVQGRGRSVLPAAQVVRPRVHHTSRKRELLALVWKGSDHMRRRSPCGAQQTGEVRGGERRRSSTRRAQQSDEATKIKEASTIKKLTAQFTPKAEKGCNFKKLQQQQQQEVSYLQVGHSEQRQQGEGHQVEQSRLSGAMDPGGHGGSQQTCTQQRSR